jgi:hypothetical protein
MVSGIVSVRGMPRAAATKASAMPVLPEVGSTSSGAEQAALLGVVDQCRADPVLYRIGGIAAFDLRQYGGAGAIEDAGELDQRRGADGLRVVCKNLGHALFLLKVDQS